MIRFKVYDGTIERVEVASETLYQIKLVNGRRVCKRTRYESWHDTWKEAQAYILKKAEMRQAHLSAQLGNINNFIACVKEMKEDEPS